jgi:hypothetical protein
MSEFPHYHRGNLLDFPWAKQDIKRISGLYQKKSKRTLDYLLKCGLPTWHFDIHTPNRVEKHKEDLKIQRHQISWLKKNHTSQILFSLYDNAQCRDLLHFMSRLYPTKSPFEND